MKVLEVIAGPIRADGIQTFVTQIIKNLDSSICIDCLTPLTYINGDLKNALNARGGNLFTFELKASDINGWYKPLYAFFKENPYDVIHINGSTIQQLATIAAATKCQKSAKIIVHSHLTGTRYNPAIHLYRSIASLSMRKYVDVYCACSKEAAAWKFTRKYQKKTHIITNGIETDRFLFDQKRRNAIRESLNISDTEFVLGNVGRLCENKNQFFTLSVFEELLKVRPDSRLILVGDGPDRSALEDTVSKKGLSERVVFTGITEDVPGYLMAMDAFILPSKHEALGFAVIEAQASGLPVVASDSLPDLVRINDSVIFLPLGKRNIPKWTDAILHVKHYAREEGVDKVKNAEFDIAHTIKQVERLYRSTC